MSPRPSDDDLVAYAARMESALAARPPELAFEPAEYRARHDRLRATMAADGLDAVLLTAADTMCWLHGYTVRWYHMGSSTDFPPTHGTIVGVDSDQTTMIEAEYHEQLVRMTSCADRFVGVAGTGVDAEPTLDDFVATLVAELAALRSGGLDGAVVGVERGASVPSPAVTGVIEAALSAAGATVVDATVLVRAARRVKSPAEIAMIESAQAAADAGVRALQAGLVAGMTELDAWQLMMAGMIAAGGEPSAMHETVAVGPPLPTVHLLSTRRRIAAGELVHADVAGCVHRYHARACRPMTVGEPAPELRRFAELGAGAFDVLTEHGRVGRPFGELTSALRAYFADSPVPAFAGGYELGVSFPPDWVGEFQWSTASDRDDVIEAGLVTNFECGPFVALVDTVVFEESGPRLLSTLPREVLVAGAGGLR